jgi:hypothetical protein
MSREIHGVRIYPDSVETVPGEGATIYVHGTVSEDCSDFFYIFRPLAELWRGLYFAKDFPVTYGENGLEDPLPGLREAYGQSLVKVDLDTQMAILKGDDFLEWGAAYYAVGGALLPIFSEVPSPEVLNDLFWSRTFRLTPATWPETCRAILHMWDDIYWQLFTTVRRDVEQLLAAHSADSRLGIYFVDLEKEYPEPSNLALESAKPVP